MIPCTGHLFLPPLPRPVPSPTVRVKQCTWPQGTGAISNKEEGFTSVVYAFLFVPFPPTTFPNRAGQLVRKRQVLAGSFRPRMEALMVGGTSRTPDGRLLCPQNMARRQMSSPGALPCAILEDVDFALEQGKAGNNPFPA